VRESRSPGSVRGVRSNAHPYRDRAVWCAKRPELTLCWPLTLPLVVAGKVDVLPTERGEVLEQIGIDGISIPI
jgi:hypothetical protein